MPSPKKSKAKAKPVIKFKDLKSSKNPKGGAFDTYYAVKLDKGKT